MNQTARNILSVLLCIIIAIALLGYVFSSCLQATVFSEGFYLRVFGNPSYAEMVDEAIFEETRAQSSYVGISPDVLLAGLDDETLAQLLNQYAKSASNFLSYRAGYSQVIVSADIFIPALISFLEADAADGGYEPSAEQLEQLVEVAADTAGIVAANVDLFRLDILRNTSVFINAHRFLYHAVRMGPYMFFTWMLSSVLLFLLNRSDFHRWLLYQFTSFWITGSLLTVPVLTLDSMDIARRLAIDTPHIKYAADTLLTGFTRCFLYSGLLLFLLSSMGLVIRIFQKTFDKPL